MYSCIHLKLSTPAIWRKYFTRLKTTYVAELKISTLSRFQPIYSQCFKLDNILAVSGLAVAAGL